jgi:LPXTG-motif cell wall-anchored protein
VRALPAASTPIVADASISKGEKVKVSYGGFTPFEYVQLIVASTPRVIGSGYANSKGVVTLEGDLPAGLASGSHTLAVFAPASGTGYKQAIVVSVGSLPSTGTNSLDGTVPAAFALLMLGSGLLTVSRRRTAPRRR